jgi:hypothetical protein
VSERVDSATVRCGSRCCSLVAQRHYSRPFIVACFQKTAHRSVTTIPEIRYTGGMATRIRKLRSTFLNRPCARGGIVREDSSRTCDECARNCRPKCNREGRRCHRLGSISKDPIGFAAGDVNQFRYVGNGPTNATDPSGLERMGHHWIPQEIFKNLKSVSRKAYYVFDKARMDPSIYNHRLDPWNGQGHRAFSRAVASIIQSYRTVYGRVISEEDATTIVKWVRDGCTNEQFLKKNAQAFETIAQWREGFLRSIVVARAAQTLDGNLTPDQLKAIAQKHINGENTPGMVKHFTPKAQAVSRKLGTRAGRALISQAAKKIIPVVAAGSTICVAKQGFAGEGPGNYEGGGVTGAIDSVLADFMWKEALDPVLRSGGQAWSDWWANLFGLDGESKKQRQIREQIRRQ